MEYNENEYIKLNRKIKNWEWYTDVNTTHLFIFCLLSANWKDGKFQGKEIKRGSFVTSLDKMKAETGLSIQQIRTALVKLQSTGEITNKSFTKYRIITVNNYDLYQSDNKQNNIQNNIQNNKQVTNNQQTNNKQVTTIEEVKKLRTKELKNNKPPLSPLREMIEERDYPDVLKDKLNEWLKYKSEKKQTYQATGFNTLLNKVDKAYKDCGADAVAGCFEKSMENNWQGVFFDKLEKQKQAFDEQAFLRRFEE